MTNFVDIIGSDLGKQTPKTCESRVTFRLSRIVPIEEVKQGSKVLPWYSFRPSLGISHQVPGSVFSQAVDAA